MLHLYLYIPVDILVISVYFNTYNSLSCNVTSLPVYTCRHLGLYILIPITHCPVMLHFYLYIPVDILVISVYFNTYNSLSCNVTSLPVYTCRHLGLYILIPITHRPVMLHLYLYILVDILVCIF